jgi:hypothetical protein
MNSGPVYFCNRFSLRVFSDRVSKFPFYFVSIREIPYSLSFWPILLKIAFEKNSIRENPFSSFNFTLDPFTNNLNKFIFAILFFKKILKF